MSGHCGTCGADRGECTCADRGLDAEWIFDAPGPAASPPTVERDGHHVLVGKREPLLEGSEAVASPPTEEPWAKEYERRKAKYREAASLSDRAHRQGNETRSEWADRAECLAALVRIAERSLDAWVLGRGGEEQ